MAALALAVLLLLALAPAASATFPGRNGELVYTVDRIDRYGTGETTLDTVNSRGRDYTELALCGDPEWGSCSDHWGPNLPSPRYAPDGQAIAFGAVARAHDPYRPQWSGFGVIGADGSGFDSHRGDGVRSLAWSPDGAGLLGEVGAGLWLMRRNGVRSRLLVPHGRAPDWSSGGRIVFEIDSDIWIRDLSGAARRLTFRGGAQPSWSPGGRWVAFERGRDVYLVKRAAGACDASRGAAGAGRCGRRTAAGSPSSGVVACTRPASTVATWPS